MKKLVLLRHAKADPKADFSDDHEKPLAARGHEDCKIVAEEITNNEIEIDYILSSDSLRTTQTTNNILRALGKNIPISFSYDLYLASPGEIIKEIANISDKVNCLMVVGHNPGMHQLANLFPASSTGDAKSRVREKFPTTALACISLNINSWQLLEPASGNLDLFITPKDFK